MTPRRGCSLLLALALLAAGCGSGGLTDRQQIAALIRQEGARPAILCDHLTESLLAQLGGRGGCLRQAASAASDASTHASSIHIRGKSATAVAVDQAGSHTLRLVKHQGVWKVSGVS